jgi:uncharacterized protein YgiM (DUF1202 family)/beta-N-acetylglucosaminidase
MSMNHTVYQTRRWLTMFAILVVVLSAYFVLSLTESYADTTAYTVKVTSTTLNVRSGAGTEYQIVGKLKYGQNIRVYGTVLNGSLKWYKIIYNQKTAYVVGSYTKVLSKTITYDPVRSGKCLQTTNIRTGPATTKPSIGILKVGTQIKLYSIYTIYNGTKYDQWHRVSYNGQVGYVIADFMKMSPTVQVYDPPKIGLSTVDSVYRTLPYISATVAGPLEKNTLVTASALVTTYTGSSRNKWYKTTYNGKTAYVYVGDVKIISSDDAIAFEAYLTAQGFPESYKKLLRGLHEDYPKWIFKAQNTGLDWSYVLSKQQKIGVSLLSSSTAESWKSFESGAYDFTKNAYVGFDGNWNAADGRVVAYYLDPRNFLNDSAIYQFMDHSFDADSQTTAMIRAIAAGSFMDTDSYANLIYNSGQASGVNPNVITSIIRQEQGIYGTSGSISGTYPGYEGYYNYFNIGAYTTSTMNAVERGLWWAKGAGTGDTSYGRPWSSRTKSVTGGAMYYKANYLDNKQNTFYLKKFNVMNGSEKVGVHQYMTHILAATNEGISLGKAYVANSDYALQFNIPIYSNMPTTAVAKPGTTGNNDNVLNTLRVIRAETEGQYTLTRSTGTTGFSRYVTNYTVKVPSTVTKIIVNGIPHNNVSYVSGSSTYVTLGPIDSALPEGYQNKGTTTLTTKVTASELPIFSGAGSTYPQIGSYKSGTTVTVLGTTTDLSGVAWYKVSYSGVTGFINSVGTNKITTTKYYSDWMTGTIKVDDLNVRKSPSTSATSLGKLASGSKIVIYGYVTVPNSDGSVTKWYMTSYKGATVTGGDVITLQPGTNVIKLTVKSTSGQTRSYTVTVNRI